ncbi:MAG: class I SAM-dependent methyltransferase [Pseudomonadales bacterium]|nr:class I SAM-dependent methyltransferase [Pseudomonadales bacterium]
MKVLSSCSSGRLLEIGCGAGTIINELSKKGFQCEAVETSAAAREIASYVNKGIASIYSEPEPCWLGRFDYVLAFEVLEHIENDGEALSLWRSWLKPGGTLIMSVPAHRKKWSISDVWAGHYRRYERHQLINLLNQSGFKIERLENYGFPLSNLLLPFGAKVHAREQRQRESPANGRDQNNAMSGIQREAASRLYPILRGFPGIMIMRTAFLFQQWTLGKDWGTGYFLLAHKTEEAA